MRKIILVFPDTNKYTILKIAIEWVPSQKIWQANGIQWQVEVEKQVIIQTVLHKYSGIRAWAFALVLVLHFATFKLDSSKKGIK